MHVDDDHMFHGAGLIQIAEDPQFTAINSFNLGKNRVSRSTFLINSDIGVFFKYASKPKPPHGEYQFHFNEENRDELDAISKKALKTFVGLVCIEAREICCLRLAQLRRLIALRRDSKGEDEVVCSVMTTLEKGKGFRVYVNAPGVKNKYLGKKLIIRRNAFPSRLFK